MEKLLKEEGSRSLIVANRRDRRTRYTDPNAGGGAAAPAKRSGTDKKTTRADFRRRLVTCFNCAEKGHLARDCTNRPAGIGPTEACFICGARAHYPTQCPVINAPRRVDEDEVDGED